MADQPTPPVDPAEARRRRLAGRFSGDTSPSKAPESQPPAAEETPKEDIPVAAPVATEAATSSGAPPSSRPAKGRVAGKEKLQPYVANDVAEAARNAWWHTRNQAQGYETFSDLIEDAIREKVAGMETEFNDGQPFPTRPRQRLRAGRPTGR
jgi:hypothetical protein